MKHADYIEAEGVTLIDKIREVPTLLKLYLIAFTFFLLLPFAS